MPDFRIVGRIEHVGPQQFVVLVASSRAEPGEFEGAAVDRQCAPSRQLAVAARNEMMRIMGEAITARGD